MLKKYGPIALGFHTIAWAATLGATFWAIKSGTHGLLPLHLCNGGSACACIQSVFAFNCRVGCAITCLRDSLHRRKRDRKYWPGCRVSIRVRIQHGMRYYRTLLGQSIYNMVSNIECEANDLPPSPLPFIHHVNTVPLPHQSHIHDNITP